VCRRAAKPQSRHEIECVSIGSRSGGRQGRSTSVALLARNEHDDHDRQGHWNEPDEGGDGQFAKGVLGHRSGECTAAV
jgi:hypothetical protein